MPMFGILQKKPRPQLAIANEVFNPRTFLLSPYAVAVGVLQNLDNPDLVSLFAGMGYERASHLAYGVKCHVQRRQYPARCH